MSKLATPRCFGCTSELSTASFLEGNCLLAPALQLVAAPSHEIVHVLEQLAPGHHTWGRVWLDEVWALRTLWVGIDLLTHVLADRRHLVLKHRAKLQILRHACLLVCRLPKHRQDHVLALLQCNRLIAPALQLVMAPCHEIVHVLEQLAPGHHPWGRVWLDKVRALRTLWVGIDLLTHVLADRRHLVLKDRAK